MEIILCLLLVFIIWILYLELSPKLGRILIRPNSVGGYTITFGGVWKLMKEPFNSITSIKNIMYWYPSMWDLNIYVIWLVTILIYYLLKYLS